MAGLATAQQVRWERALRERGDRYGPAASATARTALEALRETRAQELLELGAGQGRDTLFFARSGLRVTALDFAAAAIETIAAKCAGARLEGAVAAICHDVRRPLPFDDSAFDACYSHMLFCMALRGQELEALAAEIRRALRPGGLCVYTARATDDPDYGRGVHRGESLYELDGFVVHFFDRGLVDRLGSGYEAVEVDRFEEGPLPRRLWRVTMRKP